MRSDLDQPSRGVWPARTSVRHQHRSMACRARPSDSTVSSNCGVPGTANEAVVYTPCLVRLSGDQPAPWRRATGGMAILSLDFVPRVWRTNFHPGIGFDRARWSLGWGAGSVKRAIGALFDAWADARDLRSEPSSVPLRNNNSDGSKWGGCQYEITIWIVERPGLAHGRRGFLGGARAQAPSTG
jgi:hypothetical protein